VNAPLSVIVPSRDTREMTLGCLASIFRSDSAERIEVILVDDGSRDDTADAVRARYPEVRVLRRPASGGFAAAANDGLREATGDVLVLMNSDAEPEPDALSRLRAAFADDARLGAAGAELLDSAGAPQWSAGRRPTALWFFALASGLPGLLARVPGYRRIKPPGARGSAVAWVSGAALAIRREAWLDAGPLDERFAFYCQDLEYGERLRRRGWRVALVSGARVLHRGGATIGRRGLPLLWADLVRWSALADGPRGARAAARAFALGGRLRLAARSLAAPWIARSRRAAFREETAGYREALAAVRGCAR
jgi:GT2 family glycosyltransferase